MVSSPVVADTARAAVVRRLAVVLAGTLLAGTALVQPATAALPQPGQRGAAVRSLQQQLIRADLLRAQHNTGYYGSNTAAGVRALQRAHRLPATGRMSTSTQRALRTTVAARTGPRSWYHAESIGKSSGGRDITAYRAGERGKPVVMVVATMHGEEDFGQYVVRGLLEGRPIRGVDLWLVPALNPDGLARDRRWVGTDTDLNRNFPHRWISRANSGPRAMSARETGVIMRFLSRTRPRYLVSWHQPLIGVDTYQAKDLGFAKRLSKALRIKLRNLDCHGSCHGTMTGWYNANHGGAAITVEYASTARSTATMMRTDADAVLSVLGGRRG